MVHEFLHRNILGVEEFGKTYLDKSNLWAKKTKNTSLLFAFGARSNYLGNGKYAMSFNMSKFCIGLQRLDLHD